MIRVPRVPRALGLAGSSVLPVVAGQETDVETIRRLG